MESQTTTTAADAWAMYIYSLKSPVSKQKYPQRLAKFFAFAGMPFKINRSWEFQIKQNPIYKKQRDRFIPRGDPGSFRSGDKFV